MQRHPRRQRAAAAQRQPRAERRQHRAGDVAAVRRVFEEPITPCEYKRSAEYVAVAAEVLGRRVHDDIRAEGERPLEYRGGERVVACEQCAVPVRDLRQGRDVADLHARV
jgi:hypothetical protein